MNSELVKKALETILNPHVLVNVVSRRVRQLHAGGRPMILETGNLGLADIALREIIEGALSFEMPDVIALVRPSAQNRKRPAGWGKQQPHAEKRLAA